MLLSEAANVFLQRNIGKKIVFTNGCFDILHAGHIRLLYAAKLLGDLLFVGLNSDNSIRKNKGDSRPIMNQDLRKIVLEALKPVDFVEIFDEETPIELISLIKPLFHVKGSDRRLDQLPEAKIVESYGGKIVLIQHELNISTSYIIHKCSQKDYLERTGGQVCP